MLFALAASLTACARDAAPPRPALCPGCNVVLISLDTLRADHVGAYGYPKPTTPHVDALAARGAVFERAISQSSWTRPAHMSMFTGLAPSEHGFVSLRDRQRLDASVPTLASVLRASGYRTAAFTGGVNVAAAFGFDSGFDLYRTNGKYLRDNLEELKYWLERNAGDRFFLFAHGYEPHTPYLSDTADRIALGMRERPPRKGVKNFCRRAANHGSIGKYVAEYDAAIRRGDRYVGKLLDHLGKLGLLENSLVVFLSDHGEEFLEHGRCFHLTTLYQEVLHVPLVIAGPGIAPARIAATVPACSSIPATLVEAVGIREHPLPGVSLVPLLRGEAAAGIEPVLSETSRSIERGNGEGYVRALTTSGGKLIRWVTRKKTAYFDLVSDPDEQRPGTAGSAHDALLVEMDEWERERPARGESKDADERKEDAVDDRLDEQLKALGYVE